MTEKTDFSQRVIESIKESISAKERLLASAETIAAIARVSEVLIESLRAGHKLLLFGNGGSAADSQHIAAEFVGRFAFDRPALPALALSVNTSALTAIGNDYGFDQVFSRQIEALGAKRGCCHRHLHQRQLSERPSGIDYRPQTWFAHRRFHRRQRRQNDGRRGSLDLCAIQGNSPHSGVPHPDRPRDLTASGACNLS